MGEYALYKGQRVKIGVCDELFYLRFEDRDEVTPLPNNVNPQQDTNLFFRVPFLDEDGVLSPFKFQGLNHNRSLPLHKEDLVPFIDPDLEPGVLQISGQFSTTFSVNCYHGSRQPSFGPLNKEHLQGQGPFFLRLRYLKLTKDYTIMPTVECHICRKKWTYDWEDIWDYLPGVYQDRFQKYRDHAEKFYSVSR